MSKGTTLLRLMKKIIAPIRRARLKNRDFSIISNNCFGGFVYDNYSLIYRTPTIGLSFPSSDYLKFLKNLNYYLSCDLENITDKNSIKCKDFLKLNNLDLKTCKIYRLGDIEINFLHYSSFEQARTKWNKRKNRINYDNLIVKFNDQNGATLEEMQEFLKLPFKNKLLFTCHPYFKNSDNPSVIFMKMYEGLDYVKDDVFKFSKVINMTNYLNSLIDTTNDDNFNELFLKKFTKAEF